MDSLLRHLGQNTPIHLLDGSSTIQGAVEYMTKYCIGAVGVLVYGELVGVLTERDVLKRGVAQRVDLLTSRIVEIMTPTVLTAALADSTRATIRRMHQTHIRHVVISDPVHAGDFIGILCRDDLLLSAYREADQVVQIRASEDIETSGGQPGALPVDLAA